MPRRRKRSSAALQREQLKGNQNSVDEKLQSSQNESELASYTHRPRAFNVISGTLHQGDTRFQYPGIQCAFISLIALVRMTCKDPKSWTAGHVDSCVIDGNARFIEHCESINIQPKMLMANELPNIIHFSHKSFVCNQSDSEIEVGILKPTLGCADEGIPKGIDKAVSEKLCSSKTCLLFCGGLTIAVAKVQNNFYAFDPHSRGEDGLVNPTGTAVLMMFDHLSDLVCFIEELLLHSLKLRPSEQFELVPLCISQQSIENVGKMSLNSSCNTETSENTSSHPHVESLQTKASTTQQQLPSGQSENEYLDVSKSIESYFEDQKMRQTLFQASRFEQSGKKAKQKNEYMKNYMKRRREKETIRKKRKCFSQKKNAKSSQYI